MTIQDVKKQIEGLPGADAVEVLSAYIKEHPEDDEALTLRGMKYWGMDKRSAAINDYLLAIKLNPESKAVQALKAANEILDYYNKDLYNP